MINLNGTLIEADKAFIPINNRGFLYGDALFETIKVADSKILFWESHYFRLMASMRIMRMEIPMTFTPEFLEGEVLRTVEANNELGKHQRVKLMVNRDGQGRYLPLNQDVGYFVSCEALEEAAFTFNNEPYLVDLYKDYFVAPNLLSTLKSNNRAINILGSIYASENGYNSCLILNTEKHVIEALHHNVFLVKDNVIKTPPLADGCIKGVMREQLIEIIKTSTKFTLDETSISPFELQKADELFLSNTICGIRAVTQYRKKTFSTEVAKELLDALNNKLELS